MNEVTWGIPVAVDLFFAGVGAGSFCLGAIAARKKGQGWEACSRMASLLAPLSVLIGLSMLIIDLRNKPRFWMTLTRFNPNSPMSVGVWLLSVFFLISTIFATYEVPGIRHRLRGIENLPLWNRPDWRDRFGIAGILLALGISVYTGVLLSVSSVPLWRNPSIPLLFFLSAISTGFAGGALLAILSVRKADFQCMQQPLLFVKRSYQVLLPFYLFIALVFIFSSHANEMHGFIWLVGTVVLGIILPLILVMNWRGVGVRRAWLLFGSVLVGGFLLRIILVLSGQQF